MDEYNFKFLTLFVKKNLLHIWTFQIFLSMHRSMIFSYACGIKDKTVTSIMFAKSRET